MHSLGRVVVASQVHRTRPKSNHHSQWYLSSEEQKYGDSTCLSRQILEWNTFGFFFSCGRRFNLWLCPRCFCSRCYLNDRHHSLPLVHEHRHWQGARRITTTPFYLWSLLTAGQVNALVPEEWNLDPTSEFGARGSPRSRSSTAAAREHERPARDRHVHLLSYSSAWRPVWTLADMALSRRPSTCKALDLSGTHLSSAEQSTAFFFRIWRRWSRWAAPVFLSNSVGVSCYYSWCCWEPGLGRCSSSLIDGWAQSLLTPPVLSKLIITVLQKN
jgi:hypothetical protein